MAQRQTLTQPELDAMIAAMKALDVDEEDYDDDDDDWDQDF